MDVHVVGFLSHLQTELAGQAKAAGCNEVLPRSSFTQNLARDSKFSEGLK